MLRERTGLTEAELKRFEGRKILKATKRGPQGWWLYHESIVTDLVRRVGRPVPTQDQGSNSSREMEAIYTSEDAAKVFEHLQKGTPLITIVIEAKVHPSILRSIMREYEAFSGTIYIPKAIVDGMNKLPFDVPIPLTTAEDVFNMMVAAADEHKCLSCKKRPRALCFRCVQKNVVGGRPRPASDAGEESEPVNETPPSP